MEGDRIGLQMGDPNQEVEKILVTLDSSSPQVIEEAIRLDVDMIVAHHALIFRKLSNLRTDTPSGKGLMRLLSQGIAVYVAHTNLDVADGGVNDALARRLQLQDVEILDRLTNQKLKKLDRKSVV